MRGSTVPRSVDRNCRQTYSTSWRAHTGLGGVPGIGPVQGSLGTLPADQVFSITAKAGDGIGSLLVFPSPLNKPSSAPTRGDGGK